MAGLVNSFWESSGYDPLAWDWANASPVQNFDTGLSGNPATSGIFFKPDGTALYLTCYLNKYQEWRFSTPWDLSTAVNEKDLSGWTTNYQGLFFNNDGTKVYFANSSNANITEWDCSTPYDVETKSLVNTKVTTTGASRGIYFTPDGLTMYVGSAWYVRIDRWDLSSAWDISTASFVNSWTPDPTGGEAFRGMTFAADGSRVYACQKQWSMSTPWDTSTATYDTQNCFGGYGYFWRLDGMMAYFFLTTKIYQEEMI